MDGTPLEARRPFASLTSAGQARRLRALAERALVHYELRTRKLQLITNASNAIYRVDLRSGDPLVLRVANPSACHGEAEVEVEMAWLDALARDTDLGAPRPIPLPDGRRFVTETAPGIPEPRHCILFSFVPGYTIGRRMTAPAAEAWGRLAACLHEHASGFRLGRSSGSGSVSGRSSGSGPLDKSIGRSGSGQARGAARAGGGYRRRVRPYDRVYPYSNLDYELSEPIAIERPEFREYFGTSRRRKILEATDKIQSTIDRLRVDRKRLHLLHADLHPWNMRLHEGRALPIDFEDLLEGHPAQDIAISLHYIRHEEAYSWQRPAFQRGYESIRAWPIPDEEVLETLIAGRSLVLMNWVIATSPVDPHMRKVAPGYLRKVESRLDLIL